MTTDVFKSIGPGLDYADLNAAAAAMPANLITADQRWFLQFPIGETVFSIRQVIDGFTTDATRNIIVRAIPGQGFADHANAATNPLFYDPTKGAAIKFTGGDQGGFGFTPAYLVVEGLQWQFSNFVTYESFLLFGPNTKFRHNIIDNKAGSDFVIAANSAATNLVVERNVIVRSAAGAAISFQYANAGIAIGNTLIGVSGNGIEANFGDSVATNNAIFGFTTPLNANINSSSSHNASDAANTIGTGNLTGLTRANQFVSTTDYRLKSGNALAGAGVAVSGYTTDIYGTTLTTPPPIGATQLEQAASDGIVPTMTGSLVSSGISQTGYTIGWSGTTRSDNVGITYFESSTNGTTWTNIGNVTSLTRTGKTAGTSYNEYIRASDAAGNKSTPALSISVTTDAAPGAPVGTITTPPFKNGSRALQANLTGLSVVVLSLPLLGLVASFNSETTDSSGVNVVSSGSIVAGTSYLHVACNSTGTVVGAAILTAT